MVVMARSAGFRDTPEFARSREIRNGSAYTVGEALGIAKALRKQLALGEARLLAAEVRKKGKLDPKDDYELLRVQVTCTYKDPELPPEIAFASALDLLKRGGYDPDTTDNPEALGLAGAIWKRWWEYDGQRDRLMRSLSYYERGFAANVTTDGGYQAINAAYVLDLLGSLEFGDSMATADARAAAAKRFDAARDIRAKLIAAKMKPPEKGSAYWHYATLAEAYLGSNDLVNAEQALATAVKDSGPEDWELESTARQLAGLVQAQHRASGGNAPVEASPQWKVVQRAYGDTWAAGVRAALIGKVGLALSGGGFRASLYHIGVLARLAELDVLRYVEVLSCVSGGSIIGARYYLELRHLLQTREDHEIAQRDYVEIVERIERDFRAGIETDLRNSLFADRDANLRSARELGYTRTHRLGEMYEERLYHNVPDGEGDKQRFIDHLYIEPSLPAGALEDPMRPFNPRLENWRRKAKVPMLILNATSLNTGHAWQFTASWMGEPATHDQTMNATPPLRRLRYSEAPSAHRHVRLGHAVAASACVPGLFEPVVLDQLYQGGITVRLVDGGAFDNQGVASLLAENCTVLLVSDASGQIRLTDQPAGDPLAVALRSNDVLMARVRETQYQIASRLQRSGVLRGFMYVHLRDGLSAPPVDWIGCTDRPDAAAMVEPTQLTEYGMRTDVQRCLAELRTDLDAFSELEASALMESGYRATKYRLPSSVPPALLDGGEPAAGSNTAYAAKAEAWQFHTAVPLVATIDQPVERYQKAVRYLERGAIRMGRTLPLMPGAETIKRRALYAGLASVVLLVVGLVLDWRVTLASIGILTMVGLALGAVAVKLLGLSGDPTANWQRLSGRIVGWFAWRRAQRQLEVGTPRYLSDGKVEGFRVT